MKRFYQNDNSAEIYKGTSVKHYQTNVCVRVVPLKRHGVVLVFKARKPRSLPEAAQKAAPPYPGPTRGLQVCGLQVCVFAFASFAFAFFCSFALFCLLDMFAGLLMMFACRFAFFVFVFCVYARVGLLVFYGL